MAELPSLTRTARARRQAAKFGIRLRKERGVRPL